MKRFFNRLSTKKQESDLHSSPVKSSWPSVSSNSLPATGNSRCSNPTFQEFQQSNIPAAPLTFQQKHDSTEAGSFSTAPLPNSELDKPARQPLSKHPQSKTHADRPMLHQSRSREASVSDPAFATATQLASQSTPSDHPHQNSQNCSQQQPASIYKSYNDFDIMSSGTFDFSQHHLLSSAPDADWLNEQCVSHRLPDRPKTATEKPQGRFSQWEPEPTRTPSPRDQPASQPNSSRRHVPHNAVQFSSPHESARSRTLPHGGPSPMAARQNAGQSPVNQPMATPFAKYASRPMSGPLLSADLDTAMRANGQAPVQPHRDGFHDGEMSGKHHELLAFSILFCHAACRL